MHAVWDGQPWWTACTLFLTCIQLKHVCMVHNLVARHSSTSLPTSLAAGECLFVFKDDFSERKIDIYESNAFDSTPCASFMSHRRYSSSRTSLDMRVKARSPLAESSLHRNLQLEYSGVL